MKRDKSSMIRPQPKPAPKNPFVRDKPFDLETLRRVALRAGAVGEDAVRMMGVWNETTMAHLVDKHLEGLRLAELRVMRLRFKDEPATLVKIDEAIARREEEQTLQRKVDAGHSLAPAEFARYVELRGLKPAGRQ